MKFLGDGKEGYSRGEKSMNSDVEVGKLKLCSNNFADFSWPGTWISKGQE